MKTFKERGNALTGSACLKKAVDDQHQDNPVARDSGQRVEVCNEQSQPS